MEGVGMTYEEKAWGYYGHCEHTHIWHSTGESFHPSEIEGVGALAVPVRFLQKCQLCRGTRWI